jgi:hypothetical protein
MIFQSHAAQDGFVFHRALRHTARMMHQAPVQVVLAVEHHIVPANRAEVRQEGRVDPVRCGLPVPEHPTNVQDLPVADGGEHQD